MRYMTSEELTLYITLYGYIAIFVGTFIVGESIPIIAGLLVFQGYLALPEAIAAAFLGSTLGDQFIFFLGRWKGRSILQRYPRFADKTYHLGTMIARYEWCVVLTFRFMYGLRNITPLLLGSLRIDIWKFISLNVLSSLVWAGLFTYLGYFSGRAMGSLFVELSHYAVLIVPTFFIILLSFAWCVRLIYRSIRYRQKQ